MLIGKLNCAKNLSNFFLHVTNISTNFVDTKTKTVYHIHHIYVFFSTSKLFALPKQIIFFALSCNTLISDSQQQTSTIEQNDHCKHTNSINFGRHTSLINSFLFSLNWAATSLWYHDKVYISWMIVAHACTFNQDYHAPILRFVSS